MTLEDNFPPRGLKRRVLESVRWSIGARLSQQALSYAAFLVLARLLTPTEYGLFGMVTVVTGFATMFTELGFANAMVQAPGLKANEIAGTFIVVSLAGIGMAIIFAVGAPLLAEFFSQPQLTSLTRILSAHFVLGGLSIVPRALLQRRLAFNRLAWVDILALLCGTGMTLSLAWMGSGASSLVVGSIVSVGVGCLASVFAVAQELRTLFVPPAWPRRLLRQGLHLTGFNLINYWARNADNLLVGRWLGADSLGIYARAYGLMLLPYSQVTSVLSGVMLAALSSLHTDLERARASYLRSTAVLALVTFPISAGLSVTAGPFVEVLLGPRWLAVVPVLQILALVGPFQAVCSPLGWIAQSQGRADVLSRWGLVAGTLIVAALTFGVWTGSLNGVALSYLAITVLLTYPALRIFGRLIGLEPWKLVRPLLPVLFCTVLMTALVAAVDLLLRGQPSFVRLILDVVLGATSYLCFVILFRTAAFRDLLEIVRVRRFGP